MGVIDLSMLTVDLTQGRCFTTFVVTGKYFRRYEFVNTIKVVVHLDNNVRRKKWFYHCQDLTHEWNGINEVKLFGSNGNTVLDVVDHLLHFRQTYEGNVTDSGAIHVYDMYNSVEGTVLQ